MANEQTRDCKIHGITEFALRGGSRWRCKRCEIDAVTKFRRKESLKLRLYSVALVLNAVTARFCKH